MGGGNGFLWEAKKAKSSKKNKKVAPHVAGGNDLMFARSLRFGRKFDKPIEVIDKDKPSSNAFSFLTVAPDGDLYAVWLNGRGRDPQSTAPGTSHVYLAKATGKGATWGKNIPVANNVCNVCPCCRPSIAFGAQGEVFVAWRNVDAGDMRDMMLAVSSDHGATFRNPVLIPTVAAGTVGRVFVSWTEATDKGVQVMLSRGRKDSGAAPLAPKQRIAKKHA
jgi:hypothetical protein